MIDGKTKFIIKSVIAIVVIIVLLVMIGVSVDATTGRFGNPGWIHWIIGFFISAAGLLVAWGTVVTWLDCRNLRTYRADPDDPFTDGQSVALSGRVSVEGDPLKAPFSGKPCAAYSYQVTGQRRKHSGDSTRYAQQLCLLGFHLAPAELDCGTRKFPLGAIPDVGDNLRSITTGGEWGERAMGQIEAGAEQLPHAEEIDARGKLEDARTATKPPHSVDYFVAPNRTASNTINVTEDIVPVDVPVTILGTYSSSTQGLEGQRMGGMKVFAGNLDERLASLGEEWRKMLKIGVPLLVVGFGLLTLAWWLPG